MSLIFYTYTKVVKVLWQIDKRIAWDESERKCSTNNVSTNKLAEKNKATGEMQKKTSSTHLSSHQNSEVQNKRPKEKTQKSKNKNYPMAANGSSIAKSKMKQQLIARRKAAKMLISVALMFALCYLPIHLLNIAR